MPKTLFDKVWDAHVVDTKLRSKSMRCERIPVETPILFSIAVYVYPLVDDSIEIAINPATSRIE